MRKHEILCCLLVWATLLPAQVIKGGGTAESESQTTSGLSGTLTFHDALGTKTNTFEMVVSGTPATVAVTVNGCMPANTCTALTTLSGTSNQAVTISGGPYASYQMVYTLTGGTAPTLTFNRLASVAGIPSSINPGFIGTATVGFSPICVVDGVLHHTIGNPDDPTNCVDALNALGVTGTGEIYSAIPEDLIPNGKQPFARAATSFSGSVSLSNSLGPGSTSTCTTSPPLTCWLVSYPVIIPSGLSFLGLDPAQSGQSVNGGTTISASPTFMQGLRLTSIGSPQTPTCVASGGDGSLPLTGNMYLRASLVTNAADPPGTTGSSPKTQLRGPSTTEFTANMTPCNNAANSISWLIQSTPTRGTGTQAQDVAVYASAASGQEIEAAAVSCSTSAGSADPDGGACRLPAGGGNLTITVTSIATTLGPSFPLVDKAKSYDMSNPMFLLGQGPDTRNSSAAVIKNLTLICNTSNNDVVGAHSPTGAIEGFTGNEQSGVENVSFYAGCNQFYVNMWDNSNNSHLIGLNAGSSSGPSGTDFTGVVLDGRMMTGGTSRWFMDSTVAAHDGSNGQSVNMVLVTGDKAKAVMHGIHTENAGGGCGIKFTNAANGNVVMEGHTSGTDTIGGGTVGNALVCIDGAGVSGGVAAGHVLAQVQSDTELTGKTLIEDANIPAGYGNTNSNNVWVYNSLVNRESYAYDTNHTITALTTQTLNYNPVTFSILGTPANGTIRYCSDCNTTCTAGSSTGQMCERINGAWTH